MQVICLIIDGLQAGYIGAYGNTWIETPSLDRLATESFVADRFYATSPNLQMFYQSLLSGRHPASFRGESEPHSSLLTEELRKAGVTATLITDCDELAESPMFDDFDRRFLLENLHGNVDDIEPADEIEETQLAGRFAELTPLVEQCLEAAIDENRDELIICHLKGLADIWDAPLDLRERFRDLEDPGPFDGVRPQLLYLDENFDPDETLPLVHAYAAQVEVLDWCISGMLEMLKSDRRFDEAVFLLTSPQGFPLGEHRLLGRPDSSAPSSVLNAEHDDGQTSPISHWPIFEETIHTPLMLRLPEGRGAMSRSQALLCPEDIFAMLNECFVLREITGETLVAIAEGRLESLRDRLLIVSQQESAIFTPAWLMKVYKESADTVKAGVIDEFRLKLYSKPDDRWEANEIADRCPEVIHRLQAIHDELLETMRNDASADELVPLDNLLLHGHE